MTTPPQPPVTPGPQQPYDLSDVMPGRPARRRTRAPWIAGAATVVLLAGGGAAFAATRGNDSPDPAAAVAPSPTTSGPTTAPPTTAAPAPPSVARLGQKVLASNGRVEATVLAYRQPVKTNVDADPGMQWGAAQVRVCARAGDVEASGRPWRVAYADGEVIERADVIGATGFPAPEYPWELEPVAPGRCLKGWITFEVIAGRKPQFVQYFPDGEPLPLEWRVG